MLAPVWCTLSPLTGATFSDSARALVAWLGCTDVDETRPVNDVVEFAVVLVWEDPLPCLCTLGKGWTPVRPFIEGVPSDVPEGEEGVTSEGWIDVVEVAVEPLNDVDTGALTPSVFGSELDIPRFPDVPCVELLLPSTLTAGLSEASPSSITALVSC